MHKMFICSDVCHLQHTDSEEPEIVAVFLTVTEDAQTLRAALQLFKGKNENWSGIKPVLMDRQ